MVSAGSVIYYATHVQELRNIIQWKTWHDPVHERKPELDTPELKECLRLLDLTSRSFSAVIKELHPELLIPVVVFYLILRGLDTIEDDMTIDISEKEPLLRNFHAHLDDESWTYDGNGPNEKDRELLVKFDVVAKEYNKIKPEYKKIIIDITHRMGDGMADYAKLGNVSVQTIKNYEEYCHYVAGLVGEGCTRCFVEAKLANPVLLSRPELTESMGQFLQQTNIIRDIREDQDDGRCFWPKEVWSKYVPEFADLFLPQNRDKALYCQSEMILLALQRADECLFYMAGVKEQSVFNFVAIPQSMAIATLELCFQNPAMFEKNIKITKGAACGLMMESTQNLRSVCDVFRRYARLIHKKNSPRDPNFLDISIACGKIERFIEGIFPSQTALTLSNGEQRVPGVAAVGEKVLTAEEAEKKKKEDAEAKWDVFYIMLAVFGTLGLISALMLGAAWLAGARFDLAFQGLKGGSLFPSGGDSKLISSDGISAAAQSVASKFEGATHGEL
ncbi:bifunctional farnesyl-diphosphate farnesyltransferase/squalene synthase [Elasticomyces elasticus]|uniref:squalene synthase n=1 Tax=Elasticomyces elasticus TaxID=574655 RepID=A0AAN7WAC6_9PEZI|nr:bifunctional farnesyl-diphosphate farnesyltransferase/squalene synthase [Elasticomyces elasticus]